MRRVWPRCPVKLATGLDCPSCGGMRMAYDIVHGDARMALHDNPFLLLCSPLLAVLALRATTAQHSARGESVPRWVAYTLASAAMVWMLVRNLPRWPLKPIVRG